MVVCFKEEMQAQHLDGGDVLLSNTGSPLSSPAVCHVPTPQQGPYSLLFFTETLGNLMLVHNCNQVLIVDDLNLHLERDAYENLLEVQDLTDHGTFSTHESEGTMYPVIPDYQDSLQYHQLGLVGSFDHHTVLTQLDVDVARDEATTRTAWL